MNRRVLYAAAGAGLLITLLAVFMVLGLMIPDTWYSPAYAGAFDTASNKITQPPFPALSEMRVFDLEHHQAGVHRYLLGSDAGGRDLLALTARGFITSMEVVAAVVVARLLLGFAAGMGMAAGVPLVRRISLGMGRWISGFPYLMLAVILIDVVSPASRWLAFLVGMATIGWRDIAVTVAEQIEHVQAQPFALSARGFGNGGLRFFRMHVLPFLRPSLAVEIPFQAAAVLVLLAELGYLQVFIGGFTQLVEDRGAGETPSYVLLRQPELGQLLAPARIYLERHQLEPVLIPAIGVAVAALALELIGVALVQHLGRRRSRLAEDT